GLSADLPASETLAGAARPAAGVGVRQLSLPPPLRASLRAPRRPSAPRLTPLRSGASPMMKLTYDALRRGLCPSKARGGEGRVCLASSCSRRATMIIGVPTEIKSREHRIAINPGGVLALTRAGHEVRVQSGAGVGAGISDEE